VWNLTAAEPIACSEPTPMHSLLRRLRRTPLRDWPLLELGVAEASSVYMVAFLFSAALGVLRQMLLNASFGLGAEAAAYYAAFRLPETVALLIAGGALTNALVPVLLRGERLHGNDAGGQAAAIRLVNRALTALLVAFAPLCAIAAVAAPAFVRYLLAPGFDAATQALTAQLTRIMLLEVLLVISEAALAAVLVSRNQVLLPALAIMLRNLTLIGGVLLAIMVPSVGIYGPTIGSILDALIQLLILAPGLRRRGYRPAFELAPRDPELRATARLLVPNAVSSIANYAGNIVDTAFASLSGAVAAVGALVNAQLLVGLPIRLLGMAIGQATLPAAAALGLRGDRAALDRLLRRTLLVACGLAALASVGLLALGRPVIALLFERGAFDRAAGDITFQMLAIYALGLPAYVATEIVTRALLARHDARTPMLTNLAQLAMRATLCAALLATLGPVAIPAAFALSSMAEAGVLLLVLWRGGDREQGTGDRTQGTGKRQRASEREDERVGQSAQKNVQ
jgi:putative peptidoglycan lipid II flippase